MAAAKYGMKPIEPVAETGIKKRINSAAMARPQRISASLIIDGDTPGARQKRTMVHRAATSATPAT
jgi:hypothetical protein